MLYKSSKNQFNIYFLKREIAKKVWESLLQCSQNCRAKDEFEEECQAVEGCGWKFKIKDSFNVVPMNIFWFLWKIRNTLIYGGSNNERKIIWQLNENIIRFIKVRFYMKLEEREWTNIIGSLYKYRVFYSFKVIK